MKTTNPILTAALNKHATCFAGVLDVQDIYSVTYTNGSPGLAAILIWEDGCEEQEILSTNLPSATAPDGHVVIKDYSEHEGLADALEAANIVKKINKVAIGFGKGWIVKVNPDKVRAER